MTDWHAGNHNTKIIIIVSIRIIIIIMYRRWLAYWWIQIVIKPFTVSVMIFYTYLYDFIWLWKSLTSTNLVLFFFFYSLVNAYSHLNIHISYHTFILSMRNLHCLHILKTRFLYFYVCDFQMVCVINIYTAMVIFTLMDSSVFFPSLEKFEQQVT